MMTEAAGAPVFAPARPLSEGPMRQPDDLQTDLALFLEEGACLQALLVPAAPVLGAVWAHSAAAGVPRHEVSALQAQEAAR